MKTVKLKTKKHGVVAMGLEEFSGWAALIDAMEIIEKNNSTKTSSNHKIKSNSIVEFVNRKRLSIRDRVAREFYSEAT